MRALLVDIDSLRSDRLGAYGYDRDTSPTIDAIAENGVVFERCFASDTPCLPSRSSLATARFGIKHGAVTHWGKGQWLDLFSTRGTGIDYPSDRPFSFRHLSDEGVTTCTVTSFSKRHAAYHFSGTFRESIQPNPGGSDRGEEVTDVAIDWLKSHADDDDWLLHLNYWDVHHPYVGMKDHVEEVRESGTGVDWVDQSILDDQAGSTGVRCRDMWPTPDQHEVSDEEYIEYGDWPMPVRFDDPDHVRHLNDGYDAAVRNVDQEVDRLISTLKRLGIREETAVIITADHGEALGEHGIYAEHALAHRPCQQVPLIIDAPVDKGVTGTSVEDYVYQFDLIPTLCELFDVPTPDGWDAESLAPALIDRPFDGRETVVCGHGIYTFSRAVYHDDWMYTRIYHPGVFSIPGLYNDPDLPRDGHELLHDLETDPHMTENLVVERQTVADEMRSKLAQWKAEHVTSREGRGRDPLVEMAAADGPFLYVNPSDLAETYRDHDYTSRQIERVKNAASAYAQPQFPAE